MASPTTLPGLLIAIDGIDGAGKTTLARALAAQLTEYGLTVRTSKEPTDGPFGMRLRATAATGRLAPEAELDLLEADRAEHVAQLVSPAIAAGEVVILDRYYFSTVAYQTSGALSRESLLERSEAIAPRPDVTLILDLPVDAALERIAGRGDAANAFERADTLARCRELFAWAAEVTPGAHLVDATNTAEAVLRIALGRVILAFTEAVRLRDGELAAFRAVMDRIPLSAAV